MPENTMELLGSNNSIIHKNIGFQFLDITNFIINSFTLLNKKQRINLFKDLQEFVFDVNREQKTKEYWGKHFGEV